MIDKWSVIVAVLQSWLEPLRKNFQTRVRRASTHAFPFSKFGFTFLNPLIAEILILSRGKGGVGVKIST